MYGASLQLRGHPQQLPLHRYSAHKQPISKMKKLILSTLIGLALVNSCSADLQNGLKAYYKAANTTDSSGGGNTLTNNGSTAFNPAFIGNGFDFGSTNSTMWMNTSNTLGLTSIGNAFTMSEWVNMSAQPSGGYFNLFEFFYGSSVTAANSGSIRGGYNDTAGTKKVFWQNDAGTSVSFNTTLNTGTWYHIVLTYDGTNGASSAGLYINGVKVASGSVFGTTYYTAFPTVTTWGSERNGSASWMQGKIDETGVWNIVLTTSEINQLYNGHSGNQYSFGSTLMYFGNDW